MALIESDSCIFICAPAAMRFEDLICETSSQLRRISNERLEESAKNAPQPLMWD